MSLLRMIKNRATRAVANAVGDVIEDAVSDVLDKAVDNVTKHRKQNEHHQSECNVSSADLATTTAVCSDKALLISVVQGGVVVHRILSVRHVHASLYYSLGTKK